MAFALLRASSLPARLGAALNDGSGGAQPGIAPSTACRWAVAGESTVWSINVIRGGTSFDAWAAGAPGAR